MHQRGLKLRQAAGPARVAAYALQPDGHKGQRSVQAQVEAFVQGLVLLHCSTGLLGPVRQPRVLAHLCDIIKLMFQLDSATIM